MKKPNGKRFEAKTIVAAVLLLPHAFLSALFFGPTPEPSTCSVQTVYVRDLPPAPSSSGGGGDDGGGGSSFNLPDVCRKFKNSIHPVIFLLSKNPLPSFRPTLTFKLFHLMTCYILQPSIVNPGFHGFPGVSPTPPVGLPGNFGLPSLLPMPPNTFPPGVPGCPEISGYPWIV